MATPEGGARRRSVRRPDERDIGLEFWLAFGAYRAALVRGLAARGFDDLRETDATLLRYLAHRDGATVTELARLLEVSKQAASQHVRSFVGRGYGVLERSESDGREKVVRLTARGRRARSAAIAFADTVERDLVEAVGPTAVRGFRRTMAHLLAAQLAGASEAVRVGVEMDSRT